MITETVLGLSIFNDILEKIPLNNKILINTISPNSFTISEKDPRFKYALKYSDILVLDGLYFGLAALLLNKKKIKKVSGTDCFYHFMKIYNQSCGKVFFLGSTNETLIKIKNKAIKEYPNIEIEVLSPPFKENFNNEENENIIKKINEFRPNIVFIGMTAPKQEKWAFEHKNSINANIICTIGNVFDWYAGNQKQPEKFWINIGLEWFIRTIRRPEIIKRYPNVFKFFWILFLNIIHIRKENEKN